MDRCLVLDAMPRTHFNSVRQADDTFQSPPLQLRIGLSKSAAKAARGWVVPDTKGVVRPDFVRAQVVFLDGSVPLAPVGPVEPDRETLAPVAPCVTRGVFLESRTVLVVLLGRELPLSSFFCGRAFRLAVVLGGLAVAVSSPFWACGKQPPARVQPKPVTVVKTETRTPALAALAAHVQAAVLAETTSTKKLSTEKTPFSPCRAQTFKRPRAEAPVEVFDDNSRHSVEADTRCVEALVPAPTPAPVPALPPVQTPAGGSSAAGSCVQVKVNTSRLHVLAYLDPKQFTQHCQDMDTMANVAAQPRPRLDSLEDFAVPPDFEFGDGTKELDWF
jgi:hypothetical protein